MVNIVYCRPAHPAIRCCLCFQHSYKAQAGIPWSSQLHLPEGLKNGHIKQGMEIDGGRPVATHLDIVQAWGTAGTAATTSQLRQGQIISSWGTKHKFMLNGSGGWGGRGYGMELPFMLINSTGLPGMIVLWGAVTNMVWHFHWQYSGYKRKREV